jgi:hypothetical protein
LINYIAEHALFSFQVAGGGGDGVDFFDVHLKEGESIELALGASCVIFWSLMGLVCLPKILPDSFGPAKTS